MTRGMALAAVALTGLGVTLAPRPSGVAGAQVPAAPDRSSWRWYKGNTHAHTLESDGDSTPEEVTRWYQERGYQFLVLSDHNVLTPVDALSQQFGAAESFLLVPGEEITDRVDEKPLHVNGLNVARLVAPQGGPSVAAALQRDIDAIRAASGVPHINHPNFGWAIGHADLAGLERYRLLEIYNGHPLVNNLGGGDAPGMEEVWDRLLTAGQRIYGIAVDDAHYFKRPWDPLAPKPGTGWVVVRAPRLEAAALMASLENGDFYASTGVELESYTASPAAIDVRVRVAGTTRYRVQLVRGGAVVQTVEGPSARFTLSGSGYARVVVRDSNGASVWAQPVFPP